VIETAEAEIVVTPGVGAGPLRLGMTKDEVVVAMGPSEDRWVGFLDIEHWAWNRSLIQVQFDSRETVGDIMVCHHPSLRVTIGRIDVLTTHADAVIERLRGQLGGDWAEDGYSYGFGTSAGGFWRQCLPGDEPEDDEQTRGGYYWDTVNIATRRYEDEIAQAAERRRERAAQEG
jgi:hypothetical protein